MPMGFYDKPELQVPIKAVQVAADLPEAERSKLEVMRTETATYRAVLDAQRNRGGPFTKYSSGHLDLCAAPIPVRERP
jgi:peptidylprolyl isomerase